jgi:hypothetical protein
MTENIKVLIGSSEQEINAQDNFLQLFEHCPIPNREKLSNLGLFIRRQDLSRILFMHDLYKKIINVHGVIFEFGVRWGQNIALFENFRGIYEPFNYNRKIVGFDTFEGFPSVSSKDGETLKKGDYSVTKNYELYLEQILQFHEIQSPIAHKKKYSLIKGDAGMTLEKYLKDNPETIISLAYFDFDIYEPTKVCLQLIKNHLVKGSVIAFDELNTHDFAGETIALKEVFDLNKCRIERSQLSPLQSYFIFE